MSQAEKIYAKMKNNPLNWRIEDVWTVAAYYGLTPSRPGKGGSHVTFRAADGEKITVPAHKPIKPVYIKQLVALIKKLDH